MKCKKHLKQIGFSVLPKKSPTADLMNPEAVAFSGKLIPATKCPGIDKEPFAPIFIYLLLGWYSVFHRPIYLQCNFYIISWL